MPRRRIGAVAAAFFLIVCGCGRGENGAKVGEAGETTSSTSATQPVATESVDREALVWAGNICGGANAWLLKTWNLEDRLFPTSIPEEQYGTVEALQVAFVRYYQGLIEHTERFQRRVVAAGVPATPGGQRLHIELRTMLDRLMGLYQRSIEETQRDVQWRGGGPDWRWREHTQVVKEKIEGELIAWPRSRSILVKRYRAPTMQEAFLEARTCRRFRANW